MDRRQQIDYVINNNSANINMELNNMIDEVTVNGETIPPPKTYLQAIARRMILPLVNTRVTPNHVTTLRLLTGLIAATCFATGETTWTAGGGTAFALSMLLDRADGELARLSGKSSRWGHWFDLITDMVVNVVLFIGIGYGLSGETILGDWTTVMGVIAGLSIGAIFIVVFQFHTSGTHPGIVFNYPDGFDLDDSLIVIVLCAWFDLMLHLLITAVICAPAFLVFSLWRAKASQVS
jgi:phosphatidylglycerophosphate synthase